MDGVDADDDEVEEGEAEVVEEIRARRIECKTQHNRCSALLTRRLTFNSFMSRVCCCRLLLHQHE